MFGLSFTWSSVLLAGLLFILAYTYLTWTFGFWNGRGIKGPKPYPLIGTLYTFFRGSQIQSDRESVAKYGKIYGEYIGRNPLLVVADTAILREILVKQFHKFSDRTLGNTDLNQHEYATRKMMTLLRGAEWKRVRTTITPAFSASKMKNMTRKINESVDILLDNLKSTNDEQTETKKLTDAFVFDTMARVGFSVDLNSQKDPENPFYKNVLKLFDRGWTVKRLFLFIILMFPWLYKRLGKKFPNFITFMDKKVMGFFVDLTKRIIEGRQKGPNQGHDLDLIQLMVDAHTIDTSQEEVDQEIGEVVKRDEMPKKGLTEEEILGQSLILFFGGFDTTSNTITHLLYNLALHPECQEKARQEADDVMQDKNEVTYDMAQQFRYTEMCLSESLRLYSPASRVDRHCIEETVINGVVIPEGTIHASIYGLHYDADIWPEPEKFIPERFTPEAKAERDAFSYMPWGMGPRNCVGMRLAQLQIRIAIAKILKHFIVKTCEKTEIPLTFAPGGLLKAKNGVYLRFEQRNAE